jgi:5-methylcytosine-specific restriction endonuclease McrA
MKTASKLSNHLKELHEQRRLSKLPSSRKGRLTPAQKEAILLKTDSRCHICGCDLESENFQADHVKSHISGGTSAVENYLPSCKTCNNYRWHYLPEEIQWVLKFGVFAKTQIENETKLGSSFAEAFLKKEARREKNLK